MPTDRRKFVLLLAVLAIAGCGTTLPMQHGKSPLMPTQMSPDSIVLDMFFVRIPFGDPGVNEKLWKEIDEQQFAPELRERLARNGFRVGLVSGHIPVELSKLLELSDKPTPSADMEGAKVDALEVEPRVVRRHLQLRAGKRGEIVVSGIYPQLPMLLSDAGHVSGQTYNDAQGVFSLKSFPNADGRVRLELVPEVQHGQPQQKWVPGQGMLRLEAGRPKREFDDMAMNAHLTPGAMLVLSSLPNRPGSLGHYFFTENDSRLEQKLLLVRLSQTQPDVLFNPPEGTSVEEE